MWFFLGLMFIVVVVKEGIGRARPKKTFLQFICDANASSGAPSGARGLGLR